MAHKHIRTHRRTPAQPGEAYEGLSHYKTQKNGAEEDSLSSYSKTTHIGNRFHFPSVYLYTIPLCNDKMFYTRENAFKAKSFPFLLALAVYSPFLLHLNPRRIPRKRCAHKVSSIRILRDVLASKNVCKCIEMK